MFKYISILSLSLLSLVTFAARETIDFNDDWEFALESTPQSLDGIDALGWNRVNVPHDWTNVLSYTQVGTASSTGFSNGGIGWYRKSFTIDTDQSLEKVWIEFDGIYNHSTVWINGHKLGYRPNGYISFSYDLSEYLEAENEIVVRVDRSQYVDSRWYTGSGIYRDVRLVKTSAIHIPQWGVQVTTPEISDDQATIVVQTSIAVAAVSGQSVQVKVELKNPAGKVVAKEHQTVECSGSDVSEFAFQLTVKTPELWGLENPNLYVATVELCDNENVFDQVEVNFGIRKIEYDADRGFFLNGKSVKFKGVNLHHDAGAVGSAVPRDIWFSRVKALKGMGCNAIRTAHNPHAPDLMDACDELGVLVLAEAFDEWNVPKDKSLVYLGDNAAPESANKSYPAYFDEWAERDLKDLIRRDFNHPSIIMWSIGNEIEWTHRYYQKSSSYAIGDLDDEYYFSPPNFDQEPILARMDELLDGKEDELLKIATDLSKWVKEEDTTRWVTCGSVHPSVGFATGYADVVDIYGFNYRAVEYEGAHEHYPEAKIYGSENWVNWNEWQAVADKDYVGGIFVWTGFAYRGEAGPWPRKGLNISLFDFSGVQTPRGHMFETMWKDDPKIYLTTYPLAESEYTYHPDENSWAFSKRDSEVPAMSWLRLWEWDNYNEHWNYEDNRIILVQVYTNCALADLTVNGLSFGVQALEDYDDGCIKWMVPYRAGEIKVVGMDEEMEVACEYMIQTAGEPTQVKLTTDRTSVPCDGKSVIQVFAELQDANGNPVRNTERLLEFKSTDGLNLKAIDNGSEYYVGSHQVTEIKTYNGRAYAVFEVCRDACETEEIDTDTAAITVGISSGDSETVEVTLVGD